MAVVICLVFFLLFLWMTSEGMTDREKTQDIMRHKKLFDPAGTLDTTRKTIGWIDPITYCDTTELFRTGKFTEKNIMKVV